MKFKHKILLSAMVYTCLLLLPSCESQLDVKPEQSLTPQAAFANKLAATASTIGVYSLAQALEVFGAQPQIINDFQADNVNFIGSFPTLQEVRTFTQVTDNATIRTIFAQHYSVVLAANAVIKYVPDVVDPGYTNTDKKQNVAEAKFLRAITFFNLVNLFSQSYAYQNGTSLGIAMPLDPDALTGTASFPPRKTVAEVYAQIEKDLTEALPDLPASYSSTDQTRGRATKGAVYGMLSRLYLYKGDWSKAVGNADLLLANTTLYNLAADYKFYDQNGVEDVFSVQMTATDNSRTGSGGWDSYYGPSAKGGRGDCPFSADLIASFDTLNDKRYSTLTQIASVSGVRRIYTTKFNDPVNNTSNAPVMRTTEVLLNKAEALVKSTNTVNTDAITIVNRLRTRAGLTAWTAADFTSAQSLIDAILVERRKELCFEGHRRMDLLRNGKPLRTTGVEAPISKPGDPRVVLPIPQREIDLGSSLPQNPGY
jgi:starch-binding outer membrane protein, SusD/RagB family